MATNDVALYVVRFDGGIAFVSSDSEIEPVIAFTTSTNFVPTADNRLWALLRRDTIVRHAALRLSRTAKLKAATTSGGFVTQMRVATAAASCKWAALLEGRNAQTNLRAFGATAPNQLSGVSDVRCAPLVKSKWSQQKAKGQYCYNLYTPNHDPCGCTATAMSQIMRYHEYPQDSVAAKTYQCEVDGAAKNLTMQGGTYDWSKMTLCPNESTYVEENWEAIGKLTSDAGIAIKSSYTSGAGSSYVSLVSGALKAAFGYANGACIFNWGIAEDAIYGDGRVHSNRGLHNLAVREKVIYANLDAKCPVELGVYGYGDGQVGSSYYWEGHAIVGDGYGYSEYAGEKVPYVHINLGWHGLDDAWYNVPEIHSPNSGSYVGSKGTVFTVLSAAAYNLFPTKTGNIVAGRAYDADGEPLAGMEMTIRLTGDVEDLATNTTDEKGIYAFIVPGGVTYDIYCHDASRNLTDMHTIEVPKEALECSDEYGVYTERDENVGNYWGHDADFEMADPCARIGMTEYTSLDKALADIQADDTVEILRPASLKQPVTIGVSCKIVATNDDPHASAVNCLTGGLTVGSGVCALFENVVFTNSASVAVAAGGKAALAGTVEVGPITTADDTGIVLAGALSRNIVVHSPNMDVGAPFGTYSCDYPTASACAKFFENPANDELGGVAVAESGTLVWGAADVPDEAARVRLEVAGETRNFRSLHTLFKSLSGDARVTVLKDCALTMAETVSTRIALVGVPGVTVTASNAASFVIVGGTLAVSNMTLTGTTTDALFRVGDRTLGRDGQLILGDGVTVRDVVGSAATHGGVVYLARGRASLGAGSRIEGCVADGTDSYGGAVSAIGNASTVCLDGTVVTGCSASKGGGGIAVRSGAQIEISGATYVSGNTMQGVENDIYCWNPIRVVAPVTSADNSIGVWFDGSSQDEPFARYDSATLAEPAASARAFFNTSVAGMRAAVGDGELHWETDPETKTTDPASAHVRVIYPDATTNYYATLAIAFSDLKGDCRVELLDLYTDIESNLSVGQSVTLTSAPALGESALLDRIGGTVTVEAGAKLTITNLCVSGCYLGGFGCENYSNEKLIYVNGGSLVLEKDGGVWMFDGAGSRAASAIVVYKGRFTMKDGSYVDDCWNNYADAAKDVNTGTGGGVLMDTGSTAYLRGGEIVKCGATYGGGLALCNKSKAYVSGDFYAAGNQNLVGDPNDVLVEDMSSLILDSPLSESASIGRTIGYNADTNIAAVVQNWTNAWGDATNLVADAKRFYSNDYAGITGVAVTNATEDALIVWSTAVRDGVYTDEKGNRYGAVGITPGPTPEPQYADPEPIAFTSIVRNESEQTVTLVFTNAVRWCYYQVFATNTLEGGFALTNDQGAVLVEPVTNLQWKMDGKEIELTLPSQESARFWKAMAFPGEIEE